MPLDISVGRIMSAAFCEFAEARIAITVAGISCMLVAFITNSITIL